MREFVCLLSPEFGSLQKTKFLAPKRLLHRFLTTLQRRTWHLQLLEPVTEMVEETLTPDFYGFNGRAIGVISGNFVASLKSSK